MLFDNIDICEGNAGALTFFMDAYKMNSYGADKAFQRMKENSITGDKLYMLWNDCCDRDVEKTIQVMTNHTIEDILQHINYENGRGTRYTETEIDIKPFSKKYLLDGGNYPINILPNYKLFGGYCVLDKMFFNEIENAKEILLQQCLSVIRDILQENKETFLHIEEDKSRPNRLIGRWEILLPMGVGNND